MKEDRYDSPEAVETKFYAAFAARDLAAMMQLWADEPDVVCVHPGGPMLIGIDAVRAGWEGIFQHSPPMRIAVEVVRRETGPAVSVHVVQEHIRVEQESIAGKVLATNAYRLTDRGWRMILHHASPSTRAARPQTARVH